MSKENLSEWDKEKSTKRLKNIIEQSKVKCFSKETLAKWFLSAESLGFHLLFDQCHNDHCEHTNASETFGNFRLIQLVEL
jgi:hypothetical protein